MDESKRYNGWTNYETWNVALWIGNEEGSYRHWQAEAEDAYREAVAERSFTRAEVAALRLRERLKEDHEEAMADVLEAADRSASMWADLLGAALAEVNWLEIATHYIDDVQNDIDAEEAQEATAD